MNLINFLKNNKLTRKIFGKKEIEIIEKQLLGISLTQSEKNRLSRDIRQKFRFIREISRFNEDFGLKKGAIIKSHIEEAKEIILEDKNAGKIKRIMLFGSALKNQLTFRSDIDIAVEFDKISLRDATLFRKHILGEVDDRMDVQVYNHLPAKIRKEIDARGKTIYKREDKGKDRRDKKLSGRAYRVYA